MKYNITKETLEDLYINKNMSYMDISKIYGCNFNTIANYIKSYDIKPRTLVESHEAKAIHVRGYKITIEQINELVAKGMLMKEIAEHFHVKKQVIYRITSKYGYNYLNGENQRARHSEWLKLLNRKPEYHKYVVTK